MKRLRNFLERFKSENRELIDILNRVISFVDKHYDFFWNGKEDER